MKNNQLFVKRKKLGIEILRALLCLWVVIIHCTNTYRNRFVHRGFHVPTFFMMAFYFFYPILSQRIIFKISNRIIRLLIPYVIWPTFSFILNNFLYEILSKGPYKFKLPIRELILQIIFGARYLGIYWFQFNLIFSTLLLSIISFLFKNQLLIILYFCGIISLYLHFSCIVYNILKPFYEYIRTTLGCLIELIPLGIVGCIYKSFDLLENIKYIPLHLKLALFSLIVMFFKFDLFILIPGFRYPYILLNIIVSTILLIIFNSISLKEGKIFSIINNITKYTGGIYNIHNNSFNIDFSIHFFQNLNLIIYIIGISP